MNRVIQKFSGGKIPIAYNIIKESYTKEQRKRVSSRGIFVIFCIYAIYFCVLYLTNHEELMKSWIAAVALAIPPLILIGFFRAKGLLNYSIIGRIEFRESSLHINGKSDVSTVAYDEIESITTADGLPNFIIWENSSYGGESYKSVIVTFQLKDGRAIQINTLLVLDVQEEHKNEFRSTPPRIELVLSEIYPDYKFRNPNEAPKRDK